MTRRKRCKACDQLIGPPPAKSRPSYTVEDRVRNVEAKLPSVVRDVAAAGDIEELALLVKLRDDLAAQIEAMVPAVMDAGGYSYGDVGELLGVTRQRAHQLYSGRREA